MEIVEHLANPKDVAAAGGERPPESRGSVWADIKHAGRLIKQYFAADPWVGSGLLVLKLGLAAAASYAMVSVQTDMASVTTALAEKNASVVPVLLTSAILVFGAVLLAGIVGDWTRFTLRIRMRTNLTEGLLGKWLAYDRYYYLDRKGNVGFPEQRIQEDASDFVEQVLVLGPALITGFLPVFLYSGKLWSLSQPISLEPIGLPFVLHGYLVIATVGFAVLWTIVTHLIGSKLTRTEVTRLGLEANFRQEMSVVRENSEAIAFQRGASFEGSRIMGIFALIKENWKHYTFANLRVAFATQVPTMLFIMGPTLLCAPFVLDGRMKVGDIQFVTAAMVTVFGSIGIFIQSYQTIALLRAGTSRLRYFDESMQESSVRGDIDLKPAEGNAFAVRGLTLDLPDGRRLVEVGNLDIAPGDRVLVKGRSGAGKSTFLRALAGLWHCGRGRVEIPEAGNIYFMPQKSYMPDGTLASLMAYPTDPAKVSDERYHLLLERLGLQALKPRLHEYASWQRMLSPGEQQRIAAARAVINEPDYLFADEATSALDLHSEANLYSLLAESLPNAAIVSIAHRPTVEKFHNRIIQFSDGKAMEVDHDLAETPSN